jgi:hypothetical protein
MNGTKIMPPSDPRTIVSIPWNNATIRFVTSSNTGTIKVSDILFNIQEQLRLFGTASGTAYRVPLEYRMESVVIYSVNSGTTLEVIFFDPTNADNGTLTSQEDRGTAAFPAKLGYLYPNVVARNSLYGTTESGRTVYTYAAEQGNVAFYVRVTWRTY